MDFPVDSFFPSSDVCADVMGDSDNGCGCAGGDRDERPHRRDRG